MSHRRFLVAMGDAESMETWSGIPFHLLAAGRRTGFLHGGITLDPTTLSMRMHRAAWNAAALIRTGRPGGFQYSRGFLRRLYSADPRSESEGAELISHFPLLPPTSSRPVSYYIDATLKQNFEDYGLGARIGSRWTRDALARERDQYARAERVVCMSRWAADSVVSDYAVPPSKVFVVRAGANLDEAALSSTSAVRASDRDVLRLGFIGKDCRRKGLPFLLEVAEKIEMRGQQVEVIAVGPASGDAPQHRLLRAAGFVDKRRDLSRFAAIIGSTHFGCLFSRAEALGISTLEFIRLGVPVVGLDVGGISDCITPDVGLLFQATARAGVVADALLGAWQAETYDKMRAATAARAPDVTWARTVVRLEEIWRVR